MHNHNSAQLLSVPCFQETVDRSDLGRVAGGLVVEGEGRVGLVYQSAPVCHNGSTLVPYTTRLHFLCQQDGLVSTCTLLCFLFVMVVKSEQILT